MSAKGALQMMLYGNFNPAENLTIDAGGKGGLAIGIGAFEFKPHADILGRALVAECAAECRCPGASSGSIRRTISGCVLFRFVVRSSCLLSS